MEQTTNDVKTILGITSKGPEITGSDSMDLNIELPWSGQDSPIKVSVKFTSSVASSILAQEKLNEMARQNIDFLGKKIAEGMTYVMGNSRRWLEKAHELNNLPKHWEKEGQD